MRDNAISTLSLFGLNVIGDDIDLDEFLPPFLNALPLVIDYSENESVMEFFLWLFNKCQDPIYYELFLRVLIVLFSNPISVLNKLQLTPQLQTSLLNLLLKLIEKHPDPSGFVLRVLDGNDERAMILEEYLTESAKNQDENE